MKEMKKILAFFLCFVMVLGFVPATAFAEGGEAVGQSSDVVYVLAGSDFQPTDGKTATGVALLNKILDKVYNKYTTMDGFLFAGDYDVNYNNSVNGKAALQTAVQAVYGTEMHEVYIQGNHDPDSMVGSTLSSSGANDAEDYGVFVINEKDYMWYNNDETTIKNTAAALDAYLDAKVEAKYAQPIFVVSHLPLHYCMRTQVGGGDGKHANYIFDVLNEAGAKGLNIIFLFGHNHSHGWDDPYGGAAIFLTKGDSINIAQNSTTNYNVETLNFTYMNAGYISYYRNVNSGAETDLSMTVFAITEDDVTIERYTADGLHDLKSVGVANSHASTGKSVDGSCSTKHGGTETYAPDTSVVASAYTLTLNKDFASEEGGTDPDPDGGNTGSGTVSSIEQVTELEQGVPYVIVSNRNNLMLTGNSTTNKDGYEALLLDGTASADTEHVWYYDGTHLIYGDPDSTSTYLLMSTDTAYLGESHEYRMVDDVYLNDDGETFTLKRTDNGLHLNQYGGGSYTAASPYDQDGNADNGSKWRIYEVVTESTDTTDPTDPVEPKPENATVTKDGVSVTAPGITDLYVAAEAKTVAGYTAYMTFDINPEGYTQGDEAEVAVALDMTLFDAARPVLIIDHELDTVVIKNIVDGAVTFTTNHFSVYDAAQVDTDDVVIDPSEWVTITAPTTGATKFVYELDTNGIDTGVEYLIVANSYPKALSAAASSNNAVDIEIDGNYAYANADTYGWTFTSYSDGVYYIRLNNSTYLALSYNNAIGSSNSAGSSRRWTVTSNGDGSYVIVRNNYELRWSNSSGVFQVSNSSDGPVWLYKYKEKQTGTAQPGLYGTIVGETNYEVGVGTSWDTVKSQVQAGIDIYYTNDNTATTGTQYGDDDAGMTWTCADYNSAVPGEYTITIAYNGVTLGTAKVTVQEKTVTRIEVSPMNGKVQRGSGLTAETGSTMTVTYDDGSTAQIPVTLGMLRGDYTITKNGTYSGLAVHFGGQTAEGYTLEVVNVVGNDFPAYPQPGSVELSKYATPLDQNTGLTRVELSTSGLPAGKGVDVVIVIDTSSSMRDNYIGSKTRIEVLSESLKNMLTQFKQANPTTGKVPDIDIAIIDFNGYFPSSAGSYDQISFTNSYRNNADYAKVFTGTNAGSYIKNVGLSANDFVNNTDLTPTTIAANFTNGNCQSGTNYDGALENAYRLLEAKKAANIEDRAQYVIFLSDGAPFRYNGYNNGSTKSTYNAWNNWLQGIWTDEADFKSDYSNALYSYFYNGNGTTHPHRIAEAIKGSTDNTYDVVIRSAAGNNPAYIEQFQGLGATIYSIGFGLADDGDSNGKVTVATQQELIQVISSGEGYYYPNVQTATELDEAFNKIVSGISYAATDAVFLDQLGDDFKLQMAKSHTNSSGDAIQVDNSITVSVSNVYTIAQVGSTVNGHTVTTEDVGKPYGSDNVIETVTFNNDGTVVNSNKKTGNILIDGVICAENFFYNTTNETKTVTLKNGVSYELEKESFCWDIGIINEKQYTLSYMVYLEGSMEGTREPGGYLTNNYAKMSYINWLGNEVEQEVPSPSVGWKAAQVSYGFYLVDTEGNPLSVGGSPVPNFLTAYKVAGPILQETILLNDAQGGIITFNSIDKNVLPAGYTMYDEAATYQVVVNSGDGGGSWEITKGTEKATTYVTDYAGATDYSNALSSEDGANVSYFDTTVWFAVVWDINAKDDTVVIDYGLPVDITVIENDGLLGELGTMNSIGKQTNDVGSVSLYSGFGQNYGGSYGTAVLNGDKIRYTPTTTAMGGIEKFSYAVHYKVDDPNRAQYYYGTVSVIPATTVYYEDEFVDLITYNRPDANTGYTATPGWPTDSEKADGVQHEDRPGVDGSYIYGYDDAYESYSEYSMGSAAKISVNANQYGTATFDFYGTGFDVIALTSNTTGTLIVQVYNEDGSLAKTASVDTYYGYTYGIYEVTYTLNEHGKWEQTNVGEAPADVSAVKVYNSKDELTKEKRTENEDGSITATGYIKVWKAVENDPNALYQVPVMKISGLTYGKYTAKISALYYSSLDHTGTENEDGSKDGYELYLDAIRIYDPAGTNKEANDAYIKDGEGYPVYLEVRNEVILESGATIEEISLGRYQVTVDKTTGVMFIDSDPANTSIADYLEYGPNNELYLAKGQSVTFNLDLSSFNGTVADVQIGMKLANGSVANYAIWNANDTTDVDSGSLLTATEMYYSIMDKANGTIVIKNNSSEDCILSITNIKLTFTKDPGAVSTADIIYVDGESVTNAVNSLANVEISKPTFDPAAMDITFNRTTAAVGNNVVVTVTTSSDVRNLLVNGRIATNKTTSYLTGETTWSFTVPVEENSSFKVTVVGYDSNGEYTVPYTESVTVINMSGTQEDLLGKLFG